MEGVLKKTKYERNLEEERAEAILERDGLTYIKTTAALGLDLNEIPDLAEEGYAQMEIEKNQSRKSLENIPLVSDEESEFVRIINSKSLHNILQSKTRLKLKGILGRLKKAGYNTNYSPSMNTSEMKRCYFEARKDILNFS